MGVSIPDINEISNPLRFRYHDPTVIVDSAFAYIIYHTLPVYIKASYIVPISSKQKHQILLLHTKSSQIVKIYMLGIHYMSLRHYNIEVANQVPSVYSKSHNFVFPNGISAMSVDFMRHLWQNLRTMVVSINLFNIINMAEE